MSKKSGAVAEKPTVTVNGKSVTLPDEKFWERYSPHYEFPMSSVASGGIHILVGGIVVILFLAMFGMWAFNKTQPVVEVANVIFDGEGTSLNPGGSGGTSDGTGTGKGAINPGPKENVGQGPNNPAPPTPSTPIKGIEIDPTALVHETDDNGTRIIDADNEQFEALKNLNESVRKKIFNGVAAGKGQGGSGAGGGVGGGVGTGAGDGVGAGQGKAKLSERQKRTLRWVMVFNTRDGRDYLRQLGLLGAILAVPKGDAGEYVVYRHAGGTWQGQVEDLAKIENIYWIDDAQDSVYGLCRALGAEMTASKPHFVAFFPRPIEDKLAQLERDALAKKARLNQVTETEVQARVHSTRFAIQNNEPVVTELTLIGGR